MRRIATLFITALIMLTPAGAAAADAATTATATGSGTPWG